MPGTKDHDIVLRQSLVQGILFCFVFTSVPAVHMCIAAQ